MGLFGAIFGALIVGIAMGFFVGRWIGKSEGKEEESARWKAKGEWKVTEGERHEQIFLNFLNGETMKSSEKVKIGFGIIAVGLFVAFIVMWGWIVGKNDDQNYQVLQTPTGTVRVIDNPGWYGKWFATVWTYPRSVQKYFSMSTDEGGEKDESIRVTFNDGGTAQISTMIRFQTPVTEEMRRKAHRDFSGSTDNMVNSIRSHMINCIKATGPLMSASEHQSARKAEFTQLIDAQLRDGLYQMRKVEKQLMDRTDENGKPITVWATDIVLDEGGKPVIAQQSPLKEYGIAILQFSVTGTEYDPMTRQQFDAKKKSFLAAEQSKAEREQEVQQRLMIEEKGLREKAEVEAVANKEKAEAVIKAQKEKEVAELEAAKKLEVAKLDKQEAETRAAKDLEVAKLAKQAASEQADAIRVLAVAEEERIQKAGALTEEKKILAEIDAKMRVDVARELAKVNVPQWMIIGGGSGSDNGNDTMTTNLINLKLLESSGLLDKMPASPAKPVSKKVGK